VSLLFWGGGAVAKVSRPPQFVLISFDGGMEQKAWVLTRKFARSTRVRFTYFVSGVLYLARRHRRKYQPPGYARGYSRLAFARNIGEVRERLAHLFGAFREGHEIGSHAAGHFKRPGWTYLHWKQELGMFDRLVLGAHANNGLARAGAGAGARGSKGRWLAKKDIVGFRSPHLVRGRALYRALAASGYRYDASSTAAWGSVWPKKKGGLWRIPISKIRVAGTRLRSLATDHNFLMLQPKRGGRNRPFRRAVRSAYAQQMYESYLRHFMKLYNGNRAPMVIGHHTTLYRSGLYWAALRRFAAKVCGLPEVKCATMRALADYMDRLTAGTAAAYRKGAFPRAGRVSFDFKLGTSAHITYNPLGVRPGHLGYRFCDAVYLGPIKNTRAFACVRRRSVAQLSAAIRRRGWTIRKWDNRPDGKGASVTAHKESRKIRIEFRNCFLPPCRMGYRIIKQ
jgi:hypothetical protein